MYTMRTTDKNLACIAITHVEHGLLLQMSHVEWSICLCSRHND